MGRAFHSFQVIKENNCSAVCSFQCSAIVEDGGTALSGPVEVHEHQRPEALCTARRAGAGVEGEGGWSRE